MNTRKVGLSFEDNALEYLLKKNFLLIERNFTVRGGEIDLIMKDNEFIVFIEVKGLRNKSNTEFSIYESLTYSKKRSLKFAINHWLIRNNKVGCIWRLDFIGIVGEKIEYFQFIQI